MPSRTGLFVAASLLLGCAGSPRLEHAAEPTPADARAAADSSACATTVITGCTTIERAPVPSRAASDFGLVLDGDGNVTCDPDVMTCGVLGSPEGMALERVSEACAYYGLALLRTPRAVYVRFPQSVGVNGGPGYSLGPIEDADPESFEPLGGLMGRDAHAVFDYGARVPDLEPATFRAITAEHGCRGCDANRCLVDCVGHPLTRPRFCFVPGRAGH